MNSFADLFVYVLLLASSAVVPSASAAAAEGDSGVGSWVRGLFSGNSNGRELKQKCKTKCTKNGNLCVEACIDLANDDNCKKKCKKDGRGNQVCARVCNTPEPTKRPTKPSGMKKPSMKKPTQKMMKKPTKKMMKKPTKPLVCQNDGYEICYDYDRNEFYGSLRGRDPSNGCEFPKVCGRPNSALCYGGTSAQVKKLCDDNAADCCVDVVDPLRPACSWDDSDAGHVVVCSGSCGGPSACLDIKGRIAPNSCHAYLSTKEETCRGAGDVGYGSCNGGSQTCLNAQAVGHNSCYQGTRNCADTASVGDASCNYGAAEKCFRSTCVGDGVSECEEGGSCEC